MFHQNQIRSKNIFLIMAAYNSFDSLRNSVWNSKFFLKGVYQLYIDISSKCP